MQIDIVEEPLSNLAEHARIPAVFLVERILAIDDSAGRLSIAERKLDEPYWKNYDTLEPPATWAAKFDLAKWGLLAAFFQYQRVGGAIIAFDSPGVESLKGRRDRAVLWDLRVDPTLRRHGIGRALFRAAEDWAASKGCVEFVVETQNTNVPACRFYEGQGCLLEEIVPDVYPALPDELQFIWSKVPKAI